MRGKDEGNSAARHHVNQCNQGEDQAEDGRQEENEAMGFG